VQNRKQDVVNKSAKGIEFLFKKNKVERIAGFGKLAGKGVVEVSGPDGTKKLTTKNVILAMGSTPQDLPHIKADGKRIINSDHILLLERVPKSMLVIGAGAVGCEFASIFSRFGTKVTIVEVMPQLLPIEDEEVAKEFTRLFKKKGIDVFTDAKVESAEVTNDGVKTVITAAKGKQQTIETELVLSATGRRAVIENCGLEGTGVKVERGLVQVDPYLRTGEPNVFAIGATVPAAALAHVATAEGVPVVEQHEVIARPLPLGDGETRHRERSDYEVVEFIAAAPSPAAARSTPPKTSSVRASTPPPSRPSPPPSPRAAAGTLRAAPSTPFTAA